MCLKNHYFNKFCMIPLIEVSSANSETKKIEWCLPGGGGGAVRVEGAEFQFEMLKSSGSWMVVTVAQ